MFKRTLISAIAIACTLCLMPTAFGADAEKTKPQFFELRTYTLNENGDTALIEAYLKDAFIPAAARHGVGPVGVFKEQTPSETPRLYVLTVFPQLGQWSAFNNKLNGDKAYLKTAAPYLNTPKEAPAYARIQTQLMKAFAGFPELAVPKKVASRFFELRTYMSHSEQKHKLKVHMFNNGEIDVFLNVGMSPVFFGQNIVGADLPSLTYMNVYNSEEAMAKQWGGFKTDPGWAKLKGIEKYKGTVSNITKAMLVPTDYSGM